MTRARSVAAWGLAATLLAAQSDARADEVDDLAPGTWLEIPSTPMRDVCPPDTPGYPYSFHCANVMAAWSGGTQDTARGRLIVWGGGHADYKGNEVYAFDMLSLTWSRIWGPTPDGQIPSGGAHEVYDDGNPGSRHTYSGLAYLPPPHDAMISFGGSPWESGGISGATWRFSFGANTWSRGFDGPSQQSPGDATVYDPVTGHLFRRANSHVLEYDPDADVLIDRAQSNGGFYASNIAAALDLSTRTMVIIGAGRMDLYHLDTDVYEQDVPLQGPSVSALFGDGSPGVAYDPVEERIVVWAGGLDVYTLDLAGPTFSQHVGMGDDPGFATASGGTFGRFRYAPSRNVFVGVHDVDSNVFVYRMSEGIGIPPTPPPGGDTGGSDGGDAGESTTDSAGATDGGMDGGADAASGSQSGGADGSGGGTGTDDSDGGCSCTSGAGPSWGWLSLCAIGLVARRRRRVGPA